MTAANTILHSKKTILHPKDEGLFFKQNIKADRKHIGKCDKLDVGHKAFARFYALNGVLVDIETEELKPVGKLFCDMPSPFREAQMLFLPFSVLFINKIPPLLTFTTCQH